jgi:hypothetical protein
VDRYKGGDIANDRNFPNQKRANDDDDEHDAMPYNAGNYQNPNYNNNGNRVNYPNNQQYGSNMNQGNNYPNNNYGLNQNNPNSGYGGFYPGGNNAGYQYNPGNNNNNPNNRANPYGNQMYGQYPYNGQYDNQSGKMQKYGFVVIRRLLIIIKISKI